ncbi:M48 family metallopeptidase [Variovorax sp. dw_954]|uniref:M48 family metallopeptidase n=1 Tax=Variovorax sp. dw_954 TaxID=2720078 RepID=UPI001BD64308|nr:M48 family metallopeptidase [Variovorax sp. dw_954]
MDALYPAGPDAGKDAIVRATAAYRRQAWLAMSALLAFVAAYLGFSGWLAWKAWVLIGASLHGSPDGVRQLAVGVAAGFLAFFMLKALVFVRRGELGSLTEISAAEQPRLFAFLHRLADEANAPRPHKVYLSTRVNAAVFYDLSLANLLLPSRKNLEIGLALVNMLTVSEFKAVLAHEFGHFAQRTMAVGRWVYLAQQIAGHVVAKRDRFDNFLGGLSRADIRVAWVGWMFSLLVWAIRSLVDSLFRVVVLADRALSREMEFQADRVAVGLAGSDALVHALYRMQAAETAWDRTLEFANQQLKKGQATADLYDIQARVLVKLRAVYDDPGYGVPPASSAPAAHRVFKRDKIQMSRMWSTHPASHEREENAKSVYLSAELRGESSWTLFNEPHALRERICASLIRHIEPAPAVASREASQAALDAEYDRESYRRQYRGLYLARAVTRSATTAEQLFDPEGPAHGSTQLYPESLSCDLERLDALCHERAALTALRNGAAVSAGTRLEHRGRPIRRRDLAGVIEEVTREIADIERALAAHDRLCRSTCRVLASRAGAEWEASWFGLLRLLHYAEHAEANLLDMHAVLQNTVAMVTAKRKTSPKDAERALRDAGALFMLMSQVSRERSCMLPGPEVMALLGHASWEQMLDIGDFDFVPPSHENFNEWLKALDSWLNPITRALRCLRRAALDSLLLAEARLRDAAIARQPAGDAPLMPVTPERYDTLVTGQERPRQLRLDAWSRFQIADGWWAGTARIAVAGGVVASLMGVSTSWGTSRVTAFNGLGRNVEVQLGGQRTVLAAGASRQFEVEANQPLALTARTTDGAEIESLTVTPGQVGARYVYNIAGASPLVAWTATYGDAAARPARLLGAPRWSSPSAQHVLEAPPKQIRTSGGGGTREALSAAETRSVRENLGLLESDAERNALIAMHARWDDVESGDLLDWVMLAQALPGRDAILRERLQRNPYEVVALRALQDEATPGERQRICDRHRELQRARPDQGDLVYLTVRCIGDEAVRDATFKRGAAQYPDSVWFAYAAAHVWAAEQAWPQARQALEAAARSAPLRNAVSMELARIRRIEGGEGADLADLAAHSKVLKTLVELRGGNLSVSDGAALGYAALDRGQLDRALALAEAPSAPEHRLALMVGASDGAGPAAVAAALKAQARLAMDLDNAWMAIGLAIKSGQKTDHVLAALVRRLPAAEMKALSDFVAGLEALRDQSHDPVRPESEFRDRIHLEAMLQGVSPQLRAQAYGIGLIAWGQRAPAPWRSFAKRALLPAERPYFSG